MSGVFAQQMIIHLRVTSQMLIIEDLEEHEFLGVEIVDISELSDRDLDAIERLNPPRIDIPDEGLLDAQVTDVLRMARAKRLSHAGRVTV
jgi:hypothetical protein